MKQGAYIAEAGLDPIAWVQLSDPVLSLYAIAVAEDIFTTRAELNKRNDG